MKFSDFEYRRPDMEALKQEFSNLLDQFENAKYFEAQSILVKKINALRSDYESMNEIASIKFSIDTANEEYEREKDFFNENTPIYKEYISRYYKALASSIFRNVLEKKWGKQLFKLAELTVKTFSPDIIEDLQTENRLCSEYVKLIASAKIFFEGEERTLYGMAPFMMSKDRGMRKRAFEARTAFMESIGEKLDDIYDRLVKVRAKMAHKLGYRDFVDLGYARMNRTDYDSKLVLNFRRQVEETIVPIAIRLRERQRQRLGLNKLLYYDELFNFNTGNPVPKGKSEWIVENAKRMYSELSAETAEYIRFMIDNELLELLNKKGKAGGAYCTYISRYKAPYIFANFNGTSDDVDTLTHEAGHAFQVYCSRDFDVPEYYWPTYEACEIHSMGMEFLTWPWMELFFKEDTNKFKFMHISDALTFIPYAAAVDEFQHIVYGEPDMTPAERRRAWRQLEKKYMPHKDYEGNEYLESGAFWHIQSHIFEEPFYYIDYALAQICALQYWKMSNESRHKAWSSYMKLCRLGGSKSFVNLLREAGLKLPFDKDCVKSVAGEIEGWLNSIDDKKL
ncbi:MAG: M3 family oligoendopeptidase [Bacillota bacterium]